MHDRHGQPIPAPRLTFPTHERFREMYADEARRSATMKRLMYLADLYETYMNGGCVFDTTNTQRLLDDLDEADRAALDFDVRRNRLACLHPGRAHSRACGATCCARTARAREVRQPCLATPVIRIAGDSPTRGSSSTARDRSA